MLCPVGANKDSRIHSACQPQHSLVNVPLMECSDFFATLYFFSLYFLSFPLLISAIFKEINRDGKLTGITTTMRKPVPALVVFAITLYRLAKSKNYELLFTLHDSLGRGSGGGWHGCGGGEYFTLGCGGRYSTLHWFVIVC